MPDLRSISFATSGWRLVERGETMRRWQDDAGDALSLHFFARPPDLAASLGRLDAIRAGYRASIAEAGGGIVEIEGGRLDGVPALRTILKFRQTPTGISYVGGWTIPRADCSFAVVVTCGERGMTGLRDTAVSVKLQLPRNPDDPFRDWFRDPYDASVRSGALRNRSDDPEWDDDFPDHPLSRVRASLRSIEGSIAIADDVRRSAPFVGPAPNAEGRAWVRRLFGR